MKDTILSILVINAIYFIAALYGMADGGYGFKEIGIMMAFINVLMVSLMCIGWVYFKVADFLKSFNN